MPTRRHQARFTGSGTEDSHITAAQIIYRCAFRAQRAYRERLHESDHDGFEDGALYLAIWIDTPSKILGDIVYLKRHSDLGKKLFAVLNDGEKHEMVMVIGHEVFKQRWGDKKVRLIVDVPNLKGWQY